MDGVEGIHAFASAGFVVFSKLEVLTIDITRLLEYFILRRIMRNCSRGSNPKNSIEWLQRFFSIGTNNILDLNFVFL